MDSPHLVGRGPHPFRDLGMSVVVWPDCGAPVALQGVAAWVWRELVVSVDRAELLTRLAMELELPAAELIVEFSSAMEAISGYLVDSGRSARDHPAPRAAMFKLGIPTTRPTEVVGVAHANDLVLTRALQHSIATPPRLADADPLPVTSADAVLCMAQRILPGLANAVRFGCLTADERVADVIDALDLEAQVHALRCERELLAVAELFDGLGIEYRVLKGLATSHLDFTQPRDRQTGDVDLLVHLADHPRVISAMDEAGYRHITGGDPGPYRLYKGNYFLTADGIEIDVHHRIFRHGRASGEAIWQESQAFGVAGKEFRALSAPWRLIHAAAHSMFSGGETLRLSSYLDGAAILVRQPDALDGAIELADGLGLRGLVAEGIRRSLQLTGAPICVPEAAASCHGLRDRVALWSFSAKSRHVFREQLSLALGLPPRQAFEWFVARLRPSPEYRLKHATR